MFQFIMASSMDHKRAQDGDRGLNTGGMGVIAPNPYYTPEVAARCMEEIFLPTLAAMREEGYLTQSSILSTQQENDIFYEKSYRKVL